MATVSGEQKYRNSGLMPNEILNPPLLSVSLHFFKK
jgi:hypothetical protein